MDINEKEIMQIIASSGDSRGAAFEALKEARQGNFEKAKEKLMEAKRLIIRAHEVQTKLITKEVKGEKNEVTILMVHAQDHLMSSILSRDLIEQMVLILEENNIGG
ncbi:PTS lactose/cellobiose transporter subunit IIA [Caldifermentibacillus hisashii]|uniref:PTS lactose/cellobiose transporter subunit IIA n=1 Tax=Caldifermentibacillus hisashii TaxID=996558 RepID=UPI0031FE2BBE